MSEAGKAGHTSPNKPSSHKAFPSYGGKERAAGAERARRSPYHGNVFPLKSRKLPLCSAVAFAMTSSMPETLSWT